jgi:SAM-dependent methyltransferase
MPKTTPFEQHGSEYEAWFDQHRWAYESELQAIRELLPTSTYSIEIGVGSGRFAAPLGISIGVEPAASMRERAEQRGIHVIEGVAEMIPLDDWQFDVALMVTTICFLDDVEVAFTEVRRILKPGGQFLVAFIDATSPIGQHYQQIKAHNVFYREAVFYSVEDVLQYLDKTGFHDYSFKQTLFRPLDQVSELEPVQDGYGEGSFVVIKAFR